MGYYLGLVRICHSDWAEYHPWLDFIKVLSENDCLIPYISFKNSLQIWYLILFLIIQCTYCKNFFIFFSFEYLFVFSGFHVLLKVFVRIFKGVSLNFVYFFIGNYIYYSNFEFCFFIFDKLKLFFILPFF